MTMMTLSAKRQIVLPAELCKQVALVPGAKVEVELALDGDGIIVRPQTVKGKKSVSVLFGRVTHQGTPVAVDALLGAAVARRLAATGRA